MGKLKVREINKVANTQIEICLIFPLHITELILFCIFILILEYLKTIDNYKEAIKSQPYENSELIIVSILSIFISRFMPEQNFRHLFRHQNMDN